MCVPVAYDRVDIFALRGSMNRKNQSRSELRGMYPVAIQGPDDDRERVAGGESP